MNYVCQVHKSEQGSTKQPDVHAWNHEKRIPQFRTKTKILIIFASFGCIFSFVAYYLYNSVFLAYLYLLYYILYGIRYQRYHFSISDLDATTMQK